MCNEKTYNESSFFCNKSLPMLNAAAEAISAEEITVDANACRPALTETRRQPTTYWKVIARTSTKKPIFKSSPSIVT